MSNAPLTDLSNADAREKRLEALGTLAGKVAHDLNNLLAPLVVYPYMLLQDLDPDSSMRQPLLDMRDAALHAATVVQDLLTLSSLEPARSTATLINPLITHFVEGPTFQEIERRHPGVRLRLEIEKTAPLSVCLSPARLSQVLMNLLINAYEASTAPAEVVVRTARQTVRKPLPGYQTVPPGLYAVLEVADQGSGIAPEDLDHIFDPYFTRKERQLGRSGSGLGLAVVHGVVRDSKGFIHVRSQPNQGACFTLYLPWAEPPSAAEVVLKPPRGGSETILVVDDDPLQLDVVRHLLRSLGYKVVTARSGREAIELIQTVSVDLLLLDMVLEDEQFGGYVTYREVLKLNPRQPCVIISGYARTRQVDELISLGAASFLSKPFTAEALDQAIRAALCPA
ncbi:MAG: response regulator [Candidatus Marinimicrobia bacterium]|nr:response regulator [Candidatus Neomarinimicrobiota bacterium]